MPVEGRGRDVKAMRDLGDANIGIGEHRFRRFDVVRRQFRRSASGAAPAPRGRSPACVRSRMRLARIPPTR